jgi:urea transport system permease protein
MRGVTRNPLAKGSGSNRIPSWATINRLLGCLALAFCLTTSSVARADAMFDQGVQQLASEDLDIFVKAIEQLRETGDARALTILQALDKGDLKVDARGNLYISKGGKNEAALSGVGAPSGSLRNAPINNQVRRVLGPALAQLQLSSSDADVRLAAAEELSKRANESAVPMLNKAIAREKEDDIRSVLALALAKVSLSSTDKAQRLAAISIVKEHGDVSFKTTLEGMLKKRDDGSFVEPDADLRKAADGALSAISTRVFWINLLANSLYGLSLGSVLVLAALGLAITFGLMRVINMAHGEMLMLGAYSTYVVQNLFQEHAPDSFDYYLVFALPVAFAVTALVGALLERTVIRFLYGRPLETLLATWGLSLMLIQSVRTVFGAQNVTVANPEWLSGGVELMPNLVLPYSRIAVILFVIVVVGFVHFLLQRTPLGLHVRAVTQNREMAAGMGIPTRRVDTWTFALGSGVAGLGGVAISQLGNVGPELGQGYIVDSFMVVVVGGVGNLAGTVAGAMGLGVLNKYLEPAFGAVLGKILILALLILFIQKRPQGLFALKGRAAES